MSDGTFDPTRVQQDPTLDQGDAGDAGDVSSANAGMQLPPKPEVIVPSTEPTARQVKDHQIDGMIDTQEGDLELPEMALTTKRILAKEPKVAYVVPFDPGETKGARKTVIINGYRFDIPKNTMVYLPKSVVELLMQSAGTQIAALQDHPANLASADAEKRAALGL